MSNGKYALVTGASSGIGKAFAAALAKRGYNLIIIARRADLLQELATALQQQYKVEVITLSKDLAQANTPTEIFTQLQDRNITIEVLVNNAGIGLHGKMLQQDWQAINNMLQLNMTSLTHLTHLFAKQMATQGKGYILQVSSVGAFQPTPLYAAYAATKAYVMLMSEALDAEVRKKGVTVSTIYPGATESEFFISAKHNPNALVKSRLMTAEAVAEIGINGMFTGKRSIVPGFINWIMVVSAQLVPRKWATAMAGFVMK